MRFIIFSIVLNGFVNSALLAQSTYSDSLLLWQQNYKAAFLKDEKSPLTEADTASLEFYPINQNFQVLATFTLEPKEIDILFPTSSKKTKSYRVYGALQFEINGQAFQLLVYQNLSYLAKDSFHLFLPITDETTSVTTYGGGRYIDLSIKEINNGKILLDFNKAYNPYCAFGTGYSCPLPPSENFLKIEIIAGALLYKGTYKE